MFYIKKYADCWAIHNEDTGQSRPLTEEERKKVEEEFPELSDPQVATVYSDEIKSIPTI